MSHERNYRVYLKTVHKASGANVPKFMQGMAERIKAKVRPSDGEREIRRKCSIAIGKIEEKAHGTYIDEASNRRINQVPAAFMPHHNRLVDELYHLIVPAETDIEDPNVGEEEEPEGEDS